MIWFVVWTVLVLGAAVVLFLLLRRLWRQAVALGRELSAASLVAARLAEQVDALQAAADRDPSRTDPTVFAELDVLRQRLAELREAKGARAAARLERARRTQQSWRAYWT